MRVLKPGDQVSCKFKSGIVLSCFSTDFDEILTLEVVASDSRGYYLYIPHYFYVKNTVTITQSMAGNLKILSKFINESALYINEYQIASIKHGTQGEICKKCHEFSAMANLDTNGEFICWVCSKYPYR